MLTERQLLILRLIIQLYTETLEPIGSKTLMREADLPFSSATIRNEMMKLEELGYLEKNHTSSGRIPSSKGYRYFLDYIMPNQMVSIPQQEVDQIRSTLQNPIYEIQELFHLSADILSSLTNYTCISLGPELSRNCLTGFRLVRLSPVQLMAIIVTDREYVENKVFSIPTNVQDEELEQIVKVINKELVGLPLVQVIQRLQTDIPLLIQRYIQSQVHIIHAIKEMLHNFEQDRFHVAGKKHLLNFINSNTNVEQLKNIYYLMEEPSILNQLIQPSTNDIQIRLGNEMEHPLLKECSLITASYETPSKDKGVIAVLGPVNMPYTRIVSLIDNLRSELSRSVNYYYDRQRE